MPGAPHISPFSVVHGSRRQHGEAEVVVFTLNLLQLPHRFLGPVLFPQGLLSLSRNSLNNRKCHYKPASGRSHNGMSELSLSCMSPVAWLLPSRTRISDVAKQSWDICGHHATTVSFWGAVG